MKIGFVSVSVPYGRRNEHDQEALRVEAENLRDFLLAKDYLPEDYRDLRIDYYHTRFQIMAPVGFLWELISEHDYEVKKCEPSVHIGRGIHDILEQLDKEPSGPSEISHYNEVVNVHTPGNALSMYNRTMLLQDSCTDGLQDCLNKGWRILAICPQPDQRRPDYILGRYDQGDLDIAMADRYHG